MLPTDEMGDIDPLLNPAIPELKKDLDGNYIQERKPFKQKDWEKTSDYEN